MSVKQCNIFLSSDECQPLGTSQFICRLKQPIDLRGTANVRLALYSYGIPFTWVNISAFDNNNTLILTDAVHAVQYTIVFPDGIYDLDSINTFIYNYLDNNDPNFSDNVPYFSGVVATGQTTLTYPKVTSGTAPLYTWRPENVSDTIHTILGFTAVAISPVLGDSKIYTSTNLATLNKNIANCLILCNLASGSVVNASNSNCIASIAPSPDISVGQTITATVQQYQWCKCTTDYIEEVMITLTQNDQFTPMNILNEPFQLAITIQWD